MRPSPLKGNESNEPQTRMRFAAGPLDRGKILINDIDALAVNERVAAKNVVG